MSYPATVRSVGINKIGGVEAIEDLTLPFPKRKPNELLVKVEWGGVNFIDTYLRSGLYPAPFLPLPMTREASGVIVELPSDEALLQSEEFKLRGFKRGGKVAVGNTGSLKEYISVPWDSYVYPVPDAVSTRVAVAALLQGMTAIAQVTESYNVQKGDLVLIHTIAGGVGLLLAQLCKARGATVIGTTSTPEKAELATVHGADHVILYKSEDVVQRVNELTRGLGPHVIYDGVGKDTFDADFKMIRRKGTIVSFGNASGAVPPVPLFKLTEKNVKLLRPTVDKYVFTVDEKNFYGTELYRLVASGELKINIHGEYPFTADGVQRAQLDLVEGKTTGKLLIKVSNE
ncbi:NAD-P-binding protein [Vararia minispora EC-137]|uniref:NAD-P-binding protein n=1 Tax=Vararia minispora EC-137 TaxID=1314806 RepID=A0ACB8QJF7_9AGAM|nr:NAD-P-binding protein [Vararia minispora EC-137]